MKPPIPWSWPLGREKVRRVVECLALIAGLSGITLGDLRNTHPYLFGSLLSVVIVAAALVFVSWGSPNTFTDKESINRIWQTLLAGASHSVRVFAGDVSWSGRDAPAIRERTRNGVIVEVLCRPPCTNPVVQRNVADLIAAGASVFYYSSEDAPGVRGLLIDGRDTHFRTALTVRKTARTSVNRKVGVPGTEELYDYHAVRHVPWKDAENIDLLQQLFQKFIVGTPEGLVLIPEDLSLEKVCAVLKTVPHYRHLLPSDIRFQRVDIASAWAACRYVKDYKMPTTLSLLRGFEEQHISCFRPCYALSHAACSLVLPPILEQHNDKLVVIDGMHRLFCHYAYKQQADAECLIISRTSPLPSIPLPFTQVRPWPKKLPRVEVFDKFNPSEFRDVETLDRSLQCSAPNALSKLRAAQP